jgi:hypothetical protein
MWTPSPPPRAPDWSAEDDVLALSFDAKAGGDASRRATGTPLAGHTVTVTRTWLTERRGAPDDPIFPSRRG